MIRQFHNSTNQIFFNRSTESTWLLHSPDEFPLNNGQHLRIAYEEHNTFAFFPEMFLIDDELKTWPLDKRNCYLDGEKKLFFFKIYTKKNCENECLSFLMSKQCKCVPFYLIRKTFDFKDNPECFNEIIKRHNDFVTRWSLKPSVRCSWQRLRQGYWRNVSCWRRKL